MNIYGRINGAIDDTEKDTGQIVSLATTGPDHS